MPSLLHVSVSPSGEYSVSRGLSKEYISAWKELHPAGEVIEKDLVKDPVPHLDIEAISANYAPADKHSPAMSQKHNFRLGLIKEITSADEILISTPMWNWSVPSLLKAYIDQIIVGGVLDGSGAAGLAGKKVTFVVAQGGSYKDGAPRAGWDFATGYLELVAKALGATDIQTILAEFTLAGNAPGMESLVDAKNASVASAKNAARKRAA